MNEVERIVHELEGRMETRLDAMQERLTLIYELLLRQFPPERQ